MKPSTAHKLKQRFGFKKKSVSGDREVAHGGGGAVGGAATGSSVGLVTGSPSSVEADAATSTTSSSALLLQECHQGCHEADEAAAGVNGDPTGARMRAEKRYPSLPETHDDL